MERLQAELSPVRPAKPEVKVGQVSEAERYYALGQFDNPTSSQFEKRHPLIALRDEVLNRSQLQFYQRGRFLNKSMDH